MTTSKNINGSALMFTVVSGLILSLVGTSLLIKMGRQVSANAKNRHESLVVATAHTVAAMLKLELKETLLFLAGFLKCFH